MDINDRIMLGHNNPKKASMDSLMFLD